MIRAKKLRPKIEEFLEKYSKEEKLIGLKDKEQKYVDYLIKILNPFNEVTYIISITKSNISIYLVYTTYNMLFNYLEAKLDKIKSKTRPQQVIIYTALVKAQAKLNTYYAEVYNNISFIYIIITILSPVIKIKYFKSDIQKEVNSKSSMIQISLTIIQ